MENRDSILARQQLCQSPANHRRTSHRTKQPSLPALHSQADVDEGSLLCTLQKVRRSDYTLFTFLGVALILIMGTLIILMDMFLPVIVDHMQRRSEHANQKRLEWIQNGFLQLQRLAYQRGGMGHWTGEEDSVPMTQKDEKLALVYTKSIKINTKHASIITVREISDDRSVREDVDKHGNMLFSNSLDDAAGRRSLRFSNSPPGPSECSTVFSDTLEDPSKVDSTNSPSRCTNLTDTCIHFLLAQPHQILL